MACSFCLNHSKVQNRFGGPKLGIFMPVKLVDHLHTRSHSNAMKEAGEEELCEKLKGFSEKKIAEQVTVVAGLIEDYAN